MFGARLFAFLLLLALGLVLVRLVRTVRLRPVNGSAGSQFAVSGWSAQEISAIVREFASLCRRELRDGFHVDVRHRPGGVLQLDVPVDLGPDLFCLLLNALNYPLDPELYGRNVAVLGSVVLTPAFNALPPQLQGQAAWVYLPQERAEYDVVHVRLRSAQVYRHAFLAGQWEAASEPCMPEALQALCSKSETDDSPMPVRQA